MSLTPRFWWHLSEKPSPIAWMVGVTWGRYELMLLDNSVDYPKLTRRLALSFQVRACDETDEKR